MSPQIISGYRTEARSFTKACAHFKICMHSRGAVLNFSSAISLSDIYGFYHEPDNCTIFFSPALVCTHPHKQLLTLPSGNNNDLSHIIALRQFRQAPKVKTSFTAFQPTCCAKQHIATHQTCLLVPFTKLTSPSIPAVQHHTTNLALVAYL